MSNKYWAVGLKEWVELREGKDAPVANITQADKIVREPESHIVHSKEQGYIIQRRMVKKRLRIKAITFSGGKVLTAIKTQRLYDVTRLYVEPGMVVEVPPDYAKHLLETDWSYKCMKDLEPSSR